MMRGWIPPLPMAISMSAFGLSWVVLFAIARVGTFEATLFTLGWVHLVALGWITLIALSVLLHVIPTFLEIRWRFELFARISTLFFAAGTAVMVGGFFASDVVALQYGGTIVLVSLLVYAFAGFQGLALAMRNERSAAPIARALGITLLLLLVTAALGTFFTYVLGGHGPGRVLFYLPQSHALLGIAGWLTLLIVGVSARTIGPLTGARSRYPSLHIASTSSTFLGVVVATLAAAADNDRFILTGLGLLLFGMVAYAFDIWDILRRAIVAHRPPQFLMACATIAAICAVVLAGGAALGRQWGPVAIFVALLGWVGSAVLAHMHHIGVRVLLTQTRGEDDETRPNAVLSTPLTWLTVISYEVAVIAGTVGILRTMPSLVESAAFVGLFAFALTVSNFAIAYCRARSLPIVLG